MPTFLIRTLLLTATLLAIAPLTVAAQGVADRSVSGERPPTLGFRLDNIDAIESVVPAKVVVQPPVPTRPDDAAKVTAPIPRSVPPARNNEFSRYATRIAGQPLYVFGADFFSALQQTAARPGATVGPAVPPDYLVNAGDELLIQVSGALEGEFRQQVRRGGDITLPHVGAVRVAGVAASNLSAFVKSKLETQFHNLQVTASLVSLHGMRVHVTGFVESPGPHIVDSISTIASAIAAAGGPSEGGSYRVAELWRKGQRIASFDLYEFLVRGDRSHDLSLTAEDTVRVAPASSYQVAITGSVNRPGVYELLPTEGLRELLGYAGGLTPVADRSRLASVTIDKNGLRVVQQLPYDPEGSTHLDDGTVLHVFSTGALDPAVNSTLKIVQVDGEVQRPGTYVMPSTSKLSDAIAAAGGLTPDAFVRGLTLIRPSLAADQALLLRTSIDELERSLFESTTSYIGNATVERNAATVAATREYIDKLRRIKPMGRLVLRRTASGAIASEPLLENGDRIHVPAQPTSVSVFGAVYSQGSYLSTGPETVESVLKIAGGARPGADLGNVFVLKPDGSVRSAADGFFRSGMTTEVDPGDTVIVPTDAQRGRGWAIAKDLGTMLYQFGLGAAAFKTLK